MPHPADLRDREILHTVEIEIVDLHMQVIFSLKINCPGIVIGLVFNGAC